MSPTFSSSMMLLVLVEHARDVGQEDEALGVKRAGDRAGEGVGVDVIALAVADLARRAPAPE